MAYIKQIKSNQPDSHQTSPCYLLTFLRWSNRDTTNFSDDDFIALREPLLVINDCVNLTVSSSKKSHIHQANMVMLGGDINYSTALAPGDFVLVNMLDDTEKLFGKGRGPNNALNTSLYSRASNKQAINKANDGFKGLFKIQSVRRNIQVNSSSGTKIVVYQIQSSSFTELNQVVYFNPNLFDPKEMENIGGILNAVAPKEYASLIMDKKLSTIDKNFKRLVEFFIGESNIANVPQKKEVVRNHNKSFYIPPPVANLLGISAPKPRIKDIFRYYVGIEQYSTGQNQTISQGLNPKTTRSGSFYDSKVPPTGVTPIQAEPWAQVTTYSILQQYTNSLINEFFTTFKLTPEGDIMPCLILRQKPFTSEKFKKDNSSITVTPFLDLPRWKLSPDIIYSISMGRDEVARINFVHIIGKTRFVDMKDFVANQESKKEYQHDDNDIMRNGLRPLITGCDFDFPSDQSKSQMSGVWNKLMFDWLSNGHLKENGTVQTVGIEDPISIGDNCQIDNTVYHIESISHVMQISSEGNVKFDSTLQLSYGVDSRKDRSNYNPIYPEMEYTDAYTYRKSNWNSGNKIMPGFSDSQDIAGRTNGEEVEETKEKAFSVTPKNTIKDDK
jgi:hypothetical protein